MYTTRLDWETLRTIDSATFTGVNQPLGTPLLNPSYILKMVNNSTVLVIVSINGRDVDVCPANAFWLYDEDEGNPEHVAMPAGTQIYVRGATAGTGLVYLVTQYRIRN